VLRGGTDAEVGDALVKERFRDR